jgi:hypothetical protein
MSNEIEISKVETSDDGENLKINVEVKNSSSRTLHTYASVRNIQYDAKSKVLKLSLSDHKTSDPTAAMQVHPRYAAVDPKGTRVIPLIVPRTLTQFDLSKKGTMPVLQTIPIHEATSVEVELSWSDVPFYADTRGKKTLREQLLQWEKGVVHARFSRKDTVTKPTKKREST